MNILSRSPSLLTSFLFYTKLVLVGVLFFAGIFTWQVYSHEEERIIQTLGVEAERLDKELAQSFDYVAYMGENLSRQITSMEHVDLDEVNRLLAWFNTEEGAQSILTYTLFSWAGPDDLIVVSGQKGVLDEPMDISDRCYVKDKKQNVGKLVICDPDFGKLSRRWILPAGMGVLSRNGEYRGTIVLAIDLGSVALKLERTLRAEGLTYAILTPDFKRLVGNGVFNHPAEADEVIGSLKAEITKKGGVGTKDLRGVLKTAKGQYVYYYASPAYPYLFLTSLDEVFTGQEIRQVVLPRVVEFVMVGIFMVTVLYLIRKRIVEPIISLSKAADRLARGDVTVEVQGSGVPEIANLSSQIGRIGDYIRERKIVEQELRHKTAELREAKEVADVANKGKTEFLAFMSHEIRTPLNAILAFSEIMEKEAFGPMTNEKYLEYSRDINRSGKYLLAIINDLLDLTRAETGTIELYPEALDIESIIAECLRIVEDKAFGAGVTLHEDIGEDLPQLFADEVRLKQVLINLINNAIKFTPKGGDIYITATAEEGDDGHVNGLVIRIRDTGIGIAEQDIPTALAKFGRIQHSGGHNGVGLGLPISKKLVELQDGEFHIESVLGEGTTITLTFPRHLLRFQQSEAA